MLACIAPALTLLAPASRETSQAMYWELLEMFRKLAMAAIGELALRMWRARCKHHERSPLCAGVFAVDGAFNSAVTPDISGALAPVVQPFLGQLVTGAYIRITFCCTCADVCIPQFFLLHSCFGSARTSGLCITSCKRYAAGSPG